MDLLNALMLSAFLINIAEAAPTVDNMDMAQWYLAKYNYLDMSGMADGEAMPEGMVKNALMEFQRFANLTMTGTFDADTMTKMNMPRCGVKDMMFTPDRMKRFSTERGYRWDKTDLTFRIDGVTTDLSRSTSERLLTQAFQYWSDVSSLTFTRVNKGQAADILINFYTGEHGDGAEQAFDGEGGTLAHAYFPGSGIGGDAHFDEDELYKDAGDISLLQVAVHEFGHSLGLGHSEDSNAVMAPFYGGYMTNFRLHSDDIAGIQYLYGANSGRPDKTMPPPGPEKPKNPSGPPCNGYFDAITRTADGSTYAFQGSFVYKVTDDNGIVEGYPKEISSVFPGLPEKVDAAIFFEDIQKTYIFQGDKYWRFVNNALDPGYPKSISIWNGLPADLDAAFIWSGNNVPYFIKGNVYYRYNRRRRGVDRGYPRPMRAWNGLPFPGIRAAFQHSNKRSYFFYDGEYYRFDDEKVTVAESYPRSTVEWWLGCKPAGLQVSSTTPSNGTGVNYHSNVVTLILTIFVSLMQFLM